MYMISITDFVSHKRIAYLPAPGGQADHVSIDFNAGHPGVEEPHYHIVLWHVPKVKESLVAK
jgi:hypothetical protein